MRLCPIALATALAALTFTPAHAAGDIQITEWMYNGSEFIEFTNVGTAGVDFNGWSYDDDSRTAGTVSLTAFGVVAPGESVLLAESDAASFRTMWGLAGAVKVIGGNSANLGRADEINLFDQNNLLVDRLTYGDAAFPGTIRTLDVSGNPATLADLGGSSVATSVWVLSSLGDVYGSRAATGGAFVANPGQFVLAVPEASTAGMWLAGLGLVAAALRRRVA